MIEQITKKVALCEAQEITAYNLANGTIKFDVILNFHNQEFPGERELCENLHIAYIWQPIPRKRSHNTEALKKDLCIAAELLEKLVNHYDHILVHCEGSIDRAPFVVAKYISNVAFLTMPQAYRIVKQQRKCILEHYEWV